MRTIKLLLNEKNFYPYLHYDKMGRVHVLVPITRGGLLSTDNTCALLTEQGEFCLKILGILEEAYSDLEKDIALFTTINHHFKLAIDYPNPTIDLLNQKRLRLHDISLYKTYFCNLGNSLKRNTLNTTITSILNHAQDVNCYSFRLSPLKEDIITHVSIPIYAPTRLQKYHDKSANTGLGHALREALHRINHTMLPNHSLLMQCYKAAQESLDDKALSETTYPIIVSAVAQFFVKLDPNIHWDIAFGVALEPKLNFNSAFQYIQFILLQGEEPDVTSCVNHILNEAKIDDEFWKQYYSTIYHRVTAMWHEQPKSYSVQREALSVLIQFFMAEVNAYCFKNKISYKNFAKVIENSADYTSRNSASSMLYVFCGTVIKGLKNDDLYTRLFNFININRNGFLMSRELYKSDIDSIISRFELNAPLLLASDHQDDGYLFFPDLKGPVYNYQQNIVLPLQKLAKTLALTVKIPKALNSVDLWPRYNTLGSTINLSLDSTWSYLDIFLSFQFSFELLEALLLNIAQNEDKIAVISYFICEIYALSTTTPEIFRTNLADVDNSLIKAEIHKYAHQLSKTSFVSPCLTLFSHKHVAEAPPILDAEEHTAKRKGFRHTPSS